MLALRIRFQQIDIMNTMIMNELGAQNSIRSLKLIWRGQFYLANVALIKPKALG